MLVGRRDDDADLAGAAEHVSAIAKQGDARPGLGEDSLGIGKLADPAGREKNSLHLLELGRRIHWLKFSIPPEMLAHSSRRQRYAQKFLAELKIQTQLPAYMRRCQWQISTP